MAPGWANTFKPQAFAGWVVKPGNGGTLTPDINSPTYVSDMAKARQAADEGPQSIDITHSVNKRGRAAGFDMSYREIAEELGLDGKNPSQSAAFLVKNATEKFARNFYLMIILEALKKIGYSDEEADIIAYQMYIIPRAKGKSFFSYLRGVL